MKWYSGWENEGENFMHKVDGKVSDTWEHVAYVCDGKYQYAFADGKLIHKIDAPKPGKMVKERKLLVAGQETWLEDQVGPAQRLGAGHMAALRISSKALYTKEFTPPTKFSANKHTELLYDMTQPDDKTLFDMSGKKRHGKIIEAEWHTWQNASR